jgi:hypothetical protein
MARPPRRHWRFQKLKLDSDERCVVLLGQRCAAQEDGSLHPSADADEHR